jgi:hypothetical protein
MHVETTVENGKTEHFITYRGKRLLAVPSAEQGRALIAVVDGHFDFGRDTLLRLFEPIDAILPPQICDYQFPEDLKAQALEQVVSMRLAMARVAAIDAEMERLQEEEREERPNR